MRSDYKVEKLEEMIESFWYIEEKFIVFGINGEII